MNKASGTKANPAYEATVVEFEQQRTKVWGETDKGQRQLRNLMITPNVWAVMMSIKMPFASFAAQRDEMNPLEFEFANVMRAPSRRFARPPLRRTPLCRNPILFEVRRRPGSIPA